MSVIVDDVALCDIDSCAKMACESEIGRRYGFRAEALEEKMRAAVASGDFIVVAREGRGIEGFAWVQPKGAFGSAPYLKLIVVDEGLRSRGVGAALLAGFERRTEGVGRVWTLMVSDFNARAIAFYEKHGYAKAGEIPGFAREGITEILMVKPKK